MKKLVGVLLTTLMLVLGVVGVIMESIGQLPPDFKMPAFVQTALVIVGILIAGLGWQDELTGGKAGLIDIIRKFFDNSVYRKLALTILLVTAREVLNLTGVPGGVETAAQLLLAIAAVLGFSSANSDFRAQLAVKQGGRL
jgi:hypothetical protein